MDVGRGSAAILRGQVQLHNLRGRRLPIWPQHTVVRQWRPHLNRSSLIFSLDRILLSISPNDFLVVSSRTAGRVGEIKYLFADEHSDIRLPES